jgi:HSP20 family protein
MNSTLERNKTSKMSNGQAQEHYTAPDVNIYETVDGYVIEAEMPGVGKDAIEVLLQGNEVTIRGHKKDTQGKGVPLIRERSGDDYQRVFELDPAIDTSKIAARIEQGILVVTLPKSERVRPRKVSVTD